jgi:hypothetical protein
MPSLRRSEFASVARKQDLERIGLSSQVGRRDCLDRSRPGHFGISEEICRLGNVFELKLAGLEIVGSRPRISYNQLEVIGEDEEVTAKDLSVLRRMHES